MRQVSLPHATEAKLTGGSLRWVRSLSSWLLRSQKIRIAGVKPLLVGLLGLIFLVLISVLIALPQARPEQLPANEWRTYNHDLAGTRYSPLSQINTNNVAQLKQAWSYRPSAVGGQPSAEVTPIVVNGVMYLSSGNRIVALDPETGVELWRYQLQSGQASQRGVAYWPGDGKDSPRILFTAGARLVALEASTGKPPRGFGDNGVVEMTVPYGGVPTIFKNVAMVGASVGEYIPLG